MASVKKWRHTYYWFQFAIITITIFIVMHFAVYSLNNSPRTQLNLFNVDKMHLFDIDVQQQQNHYNDYIFKQPLYFGSYGRPRTGSTMMYNILRILIRDKIDPNVYNTFFMTDHWKQMINETFTVLHKSHISCNYAEHVLKDQKWWNKRDFLFFTSYRDVKDSICSLIKIVFNNEGKFVSKNWLINKCEAHAFQYWECKNNTNIYIAYDMSFDLLINNISKVICDIAKAIFIDDVMSNNDYMRIENELKNLKSPNKMIHPFTEIHPNHIAPNQSDNLCDEQFIMDIIKSSEICFTWYHEIRQKRINDGWINENDKKYPKLMLNNN